MARVPPPSKIPGGKFYHVLDDSVYWPARDSYMTFVEAYGGMANALLYHDGEGKGEVYNELSNPLSVFWSVLQDPAKLEQLRRIASMTPFSQVEFKNAWGRLNAHRVSPYLSDLELAHNFYIISRFSRAGALVSFQPLTKDRLRRQMQADVACWLGILPQLPAIHDKCFRWLIRNDPAIKVIKEFRKRDDAFLYLDPPYYPDTRTCPDSYGEFDMTAEDHTELVKVINDHKSKIMLCGYDNPLYQKELSHWTKIMFPTKNQLSSGKKKSRVVECVWINYNPPVPLPPGNIHPTAQAKRDEKGESGAE